MDSIVETIISEVQKKILYKTNYNQFYITRQT